MTIESVRKILDVCQEAGHVQNLLFPLPPGLTPRSMRVIHQVARLTRESKSVRVSDISEMLEVTRPGITLVLRDLAEKGYIEKDRSSGDGRVVYVSLTEAGEALYQEYIETYHAHLTEVLSELSDEDAGTLERLVHRIMFLIESDTQKKVSTSANAL